MGVSLSGLEQSVTETTICITVSSEHPLVKLANALPWNKMAEIVMPDLQQTTTKWKWWIGRKLQLRVHLGVYLLQQLNNETDRGVEKQIQDNAAYQVFCGKTVVKEWRCPDHTKIEEFRSRLSPDSQCRLTNMIAQQAVIYGFAHPQKLDVDSTIQEANIQPPSTSNLLVKATILAKRIREKLVEVEKNISPVNLGLVYCKAKQYFGSLHRKGRDSLDKGKEALKELWKEATTNILPILRHLHLLYEPHLYSHLSSYFKKILGQFDLKARYLVTRIFETCFENAPSHPGFYSFYENQIRAFNKKPQHRNTQFGRAFQLGRIGGHFAVVQKSDSIRMSDAPSLLTFVETHQKLFGNVLDSIATDRGYYSKQNEQQLLDLKLSEVYLPRPLRPYRHPPDNPLSKPQATILSRRRNGVEAMISHIKHGGQMGRSRMKSDSSTESAGYCAVLGFNLRQMMRYLTGEVDEGGSLA